MPFALVVAWALPAVLVGIYLWVGIRTGMTQRWDAAFIRHIGLWLTLALLPAWLTTLRLWTSSRPFDDLGVVALVYLGLILGCLLGIRYIMSGRAGTSPTGAAEVFLAGIVVGLTCLVMLGLWPLL